MDYHSYRPERLWDWRSFNTNNYNHVNNNLEKLRRELRVHEAIRNTAGSLQSESPARSQNRGRPVSAQKLLADRNDNRGGCTFRLTPARIYVPRHSVELYDRSAANRRRLVIDNAARKYSSDSETLRGCYEKPSERYHEMEEDLTDARKKLNNHITKLQIKEQILKEELDRLGTDNRTASNYRDTYLYKQDQGIIRKRPERRRSFGDLKIRSLSRERHEFK